MRPLWPREHGAYAQLGVPLATALLLAVPTATAALLAVAACLAFLANEPLLVLLGHRGKRARQELHRRAVARLAITAGGALATGTAGLAMASPGTLAMAGVVAVPAAILGIVSCVRAAHSLGGELVAAVALPGAGALVSVASGLPWPVAAALWAGWALGFAASVIAVHAVLGRKRGRASAARGYLLVTLAVVIAQVPRLFVALPLVAAAAAIALAAPPPRRLRAIGVALVVASIASGALVLTTG